MDTRTELLLQHAMAALRTDRTSFVIAHRLSTIRDADLILVMEDGKIVEQGDHDVAAGLGRRVRAALPVAVRRRRSLTGWRTRETSGANAPGSGRGSWCSTCWWRGCSRASRCWRWSGSRPCWWWPRWPWGWPSPYAASRGRSWSRWPRSPGSASSSRASSWWSRTPATPRSSSCWGRTRAPGCAARASPVRPCPRWCSPSRSAPASSATSAPAARTTFAVVAAGSLALLVAGGGWALGYVRWQSRARITAQVQAGLEQERTRIAADMHDLVAHTWAVVAAQADGARYSLGSARRRPLGGRGARRDRRDRPRLDRRPARPARRAPLPGARRATGPRGPRVPGRPDAVLGHGRAGGRARRAVRLRVARGRRAAAAGRVAHQRAQARRPGPPGRGRGGLARRLPSRRAQPGPWLLRRPRDRSRRGRHARAGGPGRRHASPPAPPTGPGR